MSLTLWLTWLLAAFLLGSIPFAVLIGKAKGVDIRLRGSGNPGASNLGRQIGRKWGILCFVLDVLKGLLPTVGFLLAASVDQATGYYDTGPAAATGYAQASGVAFALQWVLVAVAAVLGHVFSPFLRLRGGKGVATGLGATLGLFPIVTIPAVVAFAIWYLVCKVSGYVGLASVIAAASLPVFTLLNGLLLDMSLGETLVFVGLTAALAALVILRHRGNLSRLRDGTEPKAEWTGR
jgi:glycerol-3-phosphate acyltransferase PlsY